MCFLRGLQLKAFHEADSSLYYLCRLLTAQINTSTVSHIRLRDLNLSNLCGKSLQEVCFQHSSPRGVCWDIQSTTQIFSSCSVSLILLLFSFIHLYSYLFIEKGIWTLHTNCVCLRVHVFEQGQVQPCERRSHGKTVYCDVWMKELKYK